MYTSWPLGFQYLIYRTAPASPDANFSGGHSVVVNGCSAIDVIDEDQSAPLLIGTSH